MRMGKHGKRQEVRQRVTPRRHGAGTRGTKSDVLRDRESQC